MVLENRVNGADTLYVDCENVSSPVIGSLLDKIVDHPCNNLRKMIRHTESIDSHCPPIIPHAEERWQKRTPVNEPVDIGIAWKKTIIVGAPEIDCDIARLYQPYDLLIVVREGVIKTVLYADHHRLETEGFIYCVHCDCLIDPCKIDRTCTQCDEPITGSRTGGGMTIRLKSSS